MGKGIKNNALHEPVEPHENMHRTGFLSFHKNSTFGLFMPDK